MPYTPDTWANNDPTTPLNATRLTKLAGQYPQVMADLPAKVADSGDPIGAALSSTIGAVVDEALAGFEGGGQNVRLDALSEGQRRRAVTAGNRSVNAFGVTVGSLASASAAPSPIATLIGTGTFTDAGDIITTSVAHGLAVGDRVGFGPITTTTQINAGDVYFVRTVPTSTTFTIATTLGGAQKTFSGDGTTTGVYKNWPIRTYAWDRANTRVEPALQVTRTRAVQAGTTFPTYDFIKPDPSILTFSPGVQTGTGMKVSTLVTQAQVDVLVRRSGTAPFSIYVDGLLVREFTDAEASAAGIGSGGSYRIPLTFADARSRVITVDWDSNSALIVGFDTPIGSGIAYPASGKKGPRVLFVGDSFTEGTGASGAPNYVTWASWHMGWEDVWRCGSGSTGYVEDGTRQSLVDRYANDIITQAPDICVIAMGINDRTAYNSSPSSVTTAATTVWDAVIAARPQTQLIIVGPWSNRGGIYVDSVLVAMDTALAALASARGLRYISPIQEGWITGNGKVGATTGNGNADIYISTDGTHPSNAGHEYLGWRLAGHLGVPYIAA